MLLRLVPRRTSSPAGRCTLDVIRAKSFEQWPDSRKDGVFEMARTIYQSQIDRKRMLLNTGIVLIGMGSADMAIRPHNGGGCHKSYQLEDG